MSRRSRLSLPWVTGGAPTFPLLVLFGLNAVDELDRSAFGVLVPEIRDAFGLDNEGILSVISLVAVVALGGQVLVGYYADRFSRVRIAAAGALVWGGFTILTGLAPTIAVLIVARSLTGVGRAVNEPTHNSLLADWYPPESRLKVYGFHRAANSVGQIVGPLLAGALAVAFGWRVPFLLFAAPTAVLAVLAIARLREPVRGMHERRAMGASQETVDTEEPPPSFAEAWRICYQVRTLRRIWYSLPFLAVSLVGIGSLTSIFYEDVFGVDEFGRGVIAAVAEPFQLVGIVIGIPIANRLARRDAGLVLKLLAVAGAITAAALVALALAPNLVVAVAMNIVASSVLGVLSPGIYATSSLAMPPRARSLGFAISALYVLPGFALLGVIGAVADDNGIRVGLLVMVPVFLVGAFVMASAGAFIAADVRKVRTSTVAQAEVRAAYNRGETKLLLVKDLDVAYDNVQVLFGVNLEVDEGEIVALLGTNGAGKSTLLRAISGLVEPAAGATIFDGRDMTYATPQEVAARGVIQVPGGKGVFPTLTVGENLRIAGWLYQRDGDYVRRATEEVLDLFPVLRQRWDQPAANLSGGEQQMLTLAQAFIAKPRLLMIDELSLGLAPVIVEQLLGVVATIRARGTTIIVVEQSVNVALELAETAYFMEKGEIRFYGPTDELFRRPDVLRSVFLEGAGSVAGPEPTGHGTQQGSFSRRTAVPADPADAAGDAVLEVRSVARSFGGITAVDDVSFSVRDGQIVGIIGPNGAGKTTLFDLISGFLIPDDGTVVFDGEDVTPFPPERRARAGLGRSFQDARLFPSLTVSETLAVALEPRVEVRDPVAAVLTLPAVADSEAAVAEAVDQIIELMGLGAFADKFISELSTGSRRIVDLACIVAQQPKVLLLDEPSSGIAQRETEALGPVLLRVREVLGTALLVIEHDMPLITSISDHLVALDLGQVVTAGHPDDVVHHPDVVASYLGTTEQVIARSGQGARDRRRRRRQEPVRAGTT